MLDENRFIEEVWKKYEIETRARKKDKFYEKKQYKASNKKLLLKTVASFLLVITITATAIGGTYAVVQKYTKEEVKQERTDWSDTKSYFNRNDDNFIYNLEDGIEYGIIETYEEYMEYKERDIWENMPEMTEEDFNNNFLIVITTSHLYRAGIYISDITETEDSLEIEVRTNDEKEDMTTIVFSKLSKDKYKENIVVKYIYETPVMEGYTDIDELPREYKIEDAIEEGCVVIKNYKFYSGEDKFYEFLEKVENGENANIRVYSKYEEKQIRVRDIEYRDGKYIGEERMLKDDEYEGKKWYIVGDKITILDGGFNKTYRIISEKNYNLMDIVSIDK